MIRKIFGLWFCEFFVMVNLHKKDLVWLISLCLEVLLSITKNTNFLFCTDKNKFLKRLSCLHNISITTVNHRNTALFCSFCLLCL